MNEELRGVGVLLFGGVGVSVGEDYYFINAEDREGACDMAGKGGA